MSLFEETERGHEQIESKTPPISNTVNIFELTLAEFPITIFSSAPQEIKDGATYEYRDTIRGKDGAPVTRTWTLYKDPICGFPNESTQSTLYEIIQIWKEQGFSSPSINFGSYYNILRRKGFKGKPGKKDYARIQHDLDCLRGLRIKAQNAFWDSVKHQYVNKDFNLFNEVTTYTSDPNSNACRGTIIEASQTFYKSILNNNIFVTQLSSEEFHNLPPMAQRLSIYLSKVFKFQTVHKRSVLEFAQQLPIHAKLFKHKKLTLTRACDCILKNTNLLEGYSFEAYIRKPKDEYVVLFANKEKSKDKQKAVNSKPHSQYPKEEFEINQLVEDILKICLDFRSKSFYNKVAYYMPKEDIYQALSEVKELINYNPTVNPAAVFTNRIKTFAEQRKIAGLFKN